MITVDRLVNSLIQDLTEKMEKGQAYCDRQWPKHRPGDGDRGCCLHYYAYPYEVLIEKLEELKEAP